MSITRFAFVLSAPENERHMVRKGADMLALLRALAARRTPVRLSFGRSDAVLATELIGINPAFEELLFAPGRDPAAREQLLAAGSFGVEASLDAVRILFIASHAEITRFKGEDALRARIPDTLARMQRRESVRVAMPGNKPAFCTLSGRAPARKPGKGADAGGLQLRVLDLSIGGLGLGLPAPDSAIAPGKTLPDCRLELPGIGAVRCTLQVVYAKELAAGGSEQRLGCHFVDLPALTREQIRTTVARLERAQMAVTL